MLNNFIISIVFLIFHFLIIDCSCKWNELNTSLEQIPIEMHSNGKSFKGFLIEMQKGKEGRKFNQKDKEYVKWAISLKLNLLEKYLNLNEILKSAIQFAIKGNELEKQLFKLRKPIIEKVGKLSKSHDKKSLKEQGKLYEKLIDQKKKYLPEMKRFYYNAFMALYEYQRFAYSPLCDLDQEFSIPLNRIFSSIYVDIMEIAKNVNESPSFLQDYRKENEIPVLFFPGVYENPLMRMAVMKYEQFRNKLIHHDSISPPDSEYLETCNFEQFTGLIEKKIPYLDSRPDCTRALDFAEILAQRTGNNKNDPSFMKWEKVEKICNYKSSKDFAPYEHEFFETKIYIDLLEIEQKDSSKKEDYKNLIEFIETNIGFNGKFSLEQLEIYQKIKEKERKSQKLYKNRTIKTFTILQRAKQQLAHYSKADKSDTIIGKSLLSIKNPKLSWFNPNMKPNDTRQKLKEEIRNAKDKRDWTEALRLIELAGAILVRRDYIEIRTEYHHFIIKELKNIYKTEMMGNVENNLKGIDNYLDSLLIPIYNRSY